MHDAFGQFIGIPIVDFYGKHHEKLPTSVTIGIKDVKGTIEEANDYHAKGFRVLKVKTGLDAEGDAERIIKLKEKFKDHFTIRVDANTGYTLNDLKIFLGKTKNAGVELIEQPLLPAIDNDLLQLSLKTRKTLAADESLKNAQSALKLAQQNLYGIFNIKLMKCGGITAAKDIATIAQQAGISLFWGCNDESIISITAALHAAYSCSNTKYLDLDGSFDLSKDIVQGGFILKDGYMHTTGLPGLGYSKI